jgi:hypothetical protein
MMGKTKKGGIEAMKRMIWLAGLLAVLMALSGCGGSKPSATVSDAKLEGTTISAKAVFSGDLQAVDLEIAVSNETNRFSGAVTNTVRAFDSAKKGEQQLTVDLSGIEDWHVRKLQMGGAVITSGLHTNDILSAAGSGAKITCRLLNGKDELAQFELLAP